MSHNDYDAICKTLLPLVQSAGEAIIALQAKEFAIHQKSPREIVTEGDFLANEILKSGLMQNYPDYGWLSEESVDDPKRLNQKRVWIVDPIDGTKEFAQKIPEFAISVALVEDGLPIVAAVFNPAQNKLYSATRGGGAYLNAKRITCRDQVNEKLNLLASRSEFQKGKWDRFSYHHIAVVGSIAYKLALIAEGVADATFSLGPKNEWDIAAGVLIVQESGGKVSDQLNHSIQFNQANVLVNGIVASSAKANDLVFRIIA